MKKGNRTKLCLLRDIYRSIREFELGFQEKYDLCLNEGMTLCSLREGSMSSSDLAAKMGLSPSNMSKIIKSIEDKKLINRHLGEEDKRQMYFSLSQQGEKKLKELKEEDKIIDRILDSIYQTEHLNLSSII